MLKAKRISLDSSGVLNPLVKDYLNHASQLNDFYSYTPDLNGFSQALQKATYQNLDRNLLKEVLFDQFSKVQNGSRDSASNIERLTSNQTFTLTTGHQLCLFTGPLYFIYKIFSVINLAKELNSKFPQNHFVPVYWMAGEDHDFAEINHFRLFGKLLNWETEQSGSVGEFSTSGLDLVQEKFSEILGNSESAEELKTLFKKAYLQHSTLSDATRFLVNELFGEYGLVVVDGQDKRLKAQFKDQFWTDLKTHKVHDLVSESNKKLENLGYHIQVNPRPVNCFYAKKGIRARLEKDGDEYKVVGTDLKFTEQQLRNELDGNPERFSPNVVLRPLYQQHILPNLAYVGGPGELAYWLQYKNMFRDLHCFFPVLVPRNFVTVFEKTTLEKVNKLSFTPEQMFQEEKVLVDVLLNRSGHKPDLATEYKAIEAVYNTVGKRLTEVDKTLESAVKAELQKAVSGLQGLEAKLNRALKHQSDTEINQIRNIRQKLFPENEPQERVDNFSAFQLRYGREFFKTLERELIPFDYRQILLCDEES